MLGLLQEGSARDALRGDKQEEAHPEGHERKKEDGKTMIVKFICFMAGAIIGMITTALAVAAGDADRCDECERMREEMENEAD